ncbi:hypothetical protein D1P53_003710 [Cryptococcus gattii VGV]|nr:hypothetical protein D1P53_003710 [Cryptococcus gattii VGV]
MSVRYACSHLDTPAPPLPPSYPSSHPSFFPIEQLYFCEECDALRCDLCVGVEVASYFCPNCLFDVPGANVRGDKNSLSVQASDPPRDDATSGHESAPPAGPPYLLVCPGCRWSSKQIGWAFEKPTGIALQLLKTWTYPEQVGQEFDHIKDHLESYISSTATPTTATTTSATSATPRPRPSRHISHLTQMAAKALNRPVHGLAIRKKQGQGQGQGMGGEREKVGWDELEVYNSKTNATWRAVGLEKGMEDVEAIKMVEHAGWEGVAPLDKRWDKSWECDRMSKSSLPQRIPLKTKLTKRCPEPSCRHLLIQPDTKSVRMKIKMVAINYLPILEIGRRRRRRRQRDVEQASFTASVEAHDERERERRRRERRRTRSGLAGMSDEHEEEHEEEEPNSPLVAGETYTYQLALTNPLYDPIQIRLTQPPVPKHAPPANCAVRIATQHFTCNAAKDAWAYEDEDDVEGGDGDGDGSEDTASMTSGLGAGTMGRKTRPSVLAGGGSSRDKRREPGVEKKGNISKVAIEVDISETARGDVEFDLEVRFTYRVEGEGMPGRKGGKEEYKHFTFWVRVNLGEV